MADIISRILRPIWRLVDMRDSTYAPQFVAHPPFDLLTDGGDGPSRRIRVDSAQTGFFAGREFRTFREWSILTSGVFVIKAVTPINVILHSLSFELEAGQVRIETLLGGTEGGEFNETLPTLPRNTMTEVPQPAPTSQVSLTAGGTLTGGTLLDPLRGKTDTNTNRSVSVGASQGDERGVGPNIYYFRLTLTGVIGIFKAWWEERPEGTY